MKNTLISCDVEANGKKVTNKFVKFIVSVLLSAIFFACYFERVWNFVSD